MSELVDRGIETTMVGRLATQLRVDAIRSSTAGGSGHPTSSMSAADVMADLLVRHLHYDWDNPNHPENDHFILRLVHLAVRIMPGSGTPCRIGRGRRDRRGSHRQHRTSVGARRRRESIVQPDRHGAVMTETRGVVGCARVAVRAAVVFVLLAALPGCDGNRGNSPSTTQTTAVTSTTESTAPSEMAPKAPVEPTDKAPRIDPNGPNPFSPTVKAPAAPTAIPGNRENTG